MLRKMLATNVLLIYLILCGCSTEEPEEKTTLRIKQERIAARAVEDIKTPINKALQAKELTEEHNKQMEELMAPQ